MLFSHLVRVCEIAQQTIFCTGDVRRVVITGRTAGGTLGRGREVVQPRRSSRPGAFYCPRPQCRGRSQNGPVRLTSRLMMGGEQGRGSVTTDR